MLKKITSQKEDEQKRKKQALLKIMFLCAIALSVIAAHALLKLRKNEPRARVNNINKSLGAEDTNEVAHLQKQIQEGAAKVQESADYVRQELEASTEKAVTEGKKQVEDTANRFLYDTTLKPIIEKIHTLPPQQQQYIKEQICPAQ